jgi:hypothetical protein
VTPFSFGVIMTKFYGTGKIPKPECEPHFTLYNKKTKATAHYWIIDIKDEKNCLAYYRYDNGLWRVGKCSSIRLIDGKLYYSHRGTIESDYCEFNNDTEFHKEILVALEKSMVTKLIEDAFLQCE